MSLFTWYLKCRSASSSRKTSLAEHKQWQSQKTRNTLDLLTVLMISWLTLLWFKPVSETSSPEPQLTTQHTSGVTFSGWATQLVKSPLIAGFVNGLWFDRKTEGDKQEKFTELLAGKHIFIPIIKMNHSTIKIQATVDWSDVFGCSKLASTWTLNSQNTIDRNQTCLKNLIKFSWCSIWRVSWCECVKRRCVCPKKSGLGSITCDWILRYLWSFGIFFLQLNINSCYSIFSVFFWKENAHGAAMAAETTLSLFESVERLLQVN